MELKWEPSRFGAASPDGRGVYEVTFVMGGLGWAGTYYERGEDPLDLAISVDSHEEAMAACVEHAKRAKE